MTLGEALEQFNSLIERGLDENTEIFKYNQRFDRLDPTHKVIFCRADYLKEDRPYIKI